MAKVYSTGPLLLYVGIPAGFTTPVFLGTGESAPEIDIDLAYTPVMNDLGGVSKPFDRIYDGQEAVVSCTLNRFNAPVLAAMQAVPNSGTAPGRIVDVAGTNIPGDIGTLMGQEGCTYPLWVVFPYNQKLAFGGGSNNDMIPGYRFWSTFLISPHKIMGGTRDEKIQCIFQCQRGFGLSSGLTTGSSNLGTFALYDTFVASFANLPSIN